MRPEDFDINKVIEHLQGSSGTIQGALDDLYPDMDEMELTSEDHDCIDNEIFLCTVCNWWRETSQAAYDEDIQEQICEDCIESEDND